MNKRFRMTMLVMALVGTVALALHSFTWIVPEDSGAQSAVLPPMYRVEYVERHIGGWGIVNPAIPDSVVVVPNGTLLLLPHLVRESKADSLDGAS